MNLFEFGCLHLLWPEKSNKGPEVPPPPVDILSRLLLGVEDKVYPAPNGSK